MAVVGNAEIIPENQSAAFDDTGRTQYSATYRVQVDDPADGPEVVVNAPGLPNGGDPYTGIGNDPPNTAAIVREITPQRVGDDGLMWHVGILWQIPTNNDTEIDENGNPTTNPLQWRDQLELGWQSFSVAVWRAFYLGGYDPAGKTHANLVALGNPFTGNLGSPIVDSAEVPFDPPHGKELKLPTISIQRNEAIYSDLWRQYTNTINNDAPNIVKAWAGFDITLIPFDWIIEISAGLRFFNTVFYWEVRYDLVQGPYLENTIGGAWDFPALDLGSSARAWDQDADGRGGNVDSNPEPGQPAVRRIYGRNGQPLNQRVMMDGDGQPVQDDGAAPQNAAGTPTFSEWRTFLDLPYAALNL